MTTNREFASYPVIEYWTKIQTPLTEILTTLQYKIDRDLRAELNARSAGTRVWLLTNIRTAELTWKVIETLTFDRKELNVPLDVAVTIPPLARVIGDSLMTMVFTFEDLPTRLPWFWKSAWREICTIYDELLSTYGGQSEWADYLNGLRTERDRWTSELPSEGAPLSQAELANPSTVRYWPNPGKMRQLANDPDRRAILDYINLRFYSPLSGASHLSGTGLMAQSMWLAENEDGKRKYFSDQVLKGLTLLLGMISQVVLDAVRDSVLARRIVDLWQHVLFADSVSETYNRCFRSKLEALAGH